jgi:prephenate dehydratase
MIFLLRSNDCRLCAKSREPSVRFNAAQFYAEVEGHPDHRNVRLALEELDFFTREVRILGVFPQHPYRLQADGEEE